MRILLVEDNELLGDGLQTALKQENYAVDWLKNGRDALSAPVSEHFDLVILDLGVPGIDGMTLLKSWRQQKIMTPVLILTARDTIDAKVTGLDAGADDFLAKPFERAELMARLRSLLRRSQKVDALNATIIHGQLELDTVSHAVRYCGNPVNVSRREFALLHSLLEKPGRVLTREQLQQAIYSWDSDVTSNTMEVYIHNLRKKLYPTVIRTLRGIGYVAGSPEGDPSPVEQR